MNYLDLFAGIGGFAKGFRDAGFKFDKHYFSEVDKYAESIYQRQFPESIRLGDVRKVGNEHGKVNLITGGFPCQAFIVAGKRRGFDDTKRYKCLGNAVTVKVIYDIAKTIKKAIDKQSIN